MHPVIAAHKSAIDELCRRHCVRRLELFGSAAGKDFNPAAQDMDFLVEFDAGADINAFEAYFDLKQSLSSLLGCPVDLVMPSAIRNPYFRASVESSREALYGA
ncbi:MAG: hypothetical protein EG825_11390 [Rhodocyclaceae bacterium]|nr:hypothetical protein [Rhodocyclaceae bacterium]